MVESGRECRVWGTQKGEWCLWASSYCFQFTGFPPSVLLFFCCKAKEAPGNG